MKKRLLSLLFVFTLVFTAIPSFAGAAASTQGVFFYDTFTANIGSVKDYGTSTENQAVRFHSKSGAKYTYVSDNSKVLKATGVKVAYDETFYEETGRVFITGVASGTANLTLKETIKGKTKVVGKLKVKVVNADISAYPENIKHEFGLGNQNSYLKFINRNSNAIYDFKANKKGLTFSTKKDEDGSMSIQMDATEYGNYVVTASETVNGKTRKIKDINFYVKETIIPDSITVEGSSANIVDYIKFTNFNYSYGLNIKEQDIFKSSGSLDFINRNTESNKSTTDYNVFNVGNVGDGLTGFLKANKSVSITADVYRNKFNATDDDVSEFVKTIKVTFKF